MEEENNNMFDLESENIQQSVYDLPKEEEEVIGIDLYDLNNKKYEYEFDIKKKAGEFLALCLNDLGIEDPRNEIVMYVPKKKKYLDKEKTLEENGVESLEELYLRKNVQPIGSKSYTNTNPMSSEIKQDPPSIRVFIVDSNNKTEEFSVYKSSTVRELLTAYSERVGGIQKIDDLKLSYRGKNLDNEKRLSDESIGNNDKLHLTVKLHGGLF